MNVKIDIHKDKFNLKLKNVSDWKVPASTKKEIIDFIEKAKIGQVNQGKKLSDRTLSKYLTLLKCSLEILNKETSKLTKKDIEHFDQVISKKGLKSVVDYRINLKLFLNWKLGVEKTQTLAGWFDTRQKIKTPDYLSEKEIEKIYKNCKNASERFLVAVLFDSGARAEEFLNIRYEDIQLPEGNDQFVKITLKEEYSKTKGRTISLYWRHSLNAVKDYLDERIDEGIRSNEAVYNKNYDAVRMFINRLGKKILKKRVTPHLFRHSSATYYASKLNRQELCYRYGWAFSSDMPDVYISRSGMENKQLDEKFKATELEEMKNKFDQEKQDNSIELKRIRMELENRKKYDAIIENLIKSNPKLMAGVTI